MSAAFMARLKGFEPLAHGLEGRCSIQLSYRRQLFVCKTDKKMERVMGIGPTRPAWKAGILPLNYTRKAHQFLMLTDFITLTICCQENTSYML
jgi:hypothetical protein